MCKNDFPTTHRSIDPNFSGQEGSIIMLNMLHYPIVCQFLNSTGRFKFKWIYFDFHVDDLWITVYIVILYVIYNVYIYIYTYYTHLDRTSMMLCYHPKSPNPLCIRPSTIWHLFVHIDGWTRGALTTMRSAWWLMING